VSVFDFFREELSSGNNTGQHNAYDFLEKTTYRLCCLPTRGAITSKNVLSWNKALKESLENTPCKIELSVGTIEKLKKFTPQELHSLIDKKVYNRLL
jgi:hypothetical protein